MRTTATSTAAKPSSTRRARGFTVVIMGAALTTCAVAGSGCGADPASALAAVETAKSAVAVTKWTVENVPPAIQAIAENFANSSSRNWGQPTHVYMSDDYYVFVFSTPESELRRGPPRMVVVDSLGRIERLQRMERGQL
jgi:hypothetical protein